MSHPRLVIGTAGHVDHGKTTLVRALTGVDLDRLPEEKARGITIALGFTPLVLASGRVAGLVDVPGHERLVRTMVAGASGLDAVLLCVAADEGAMPQTREHLAILQLLGVRAGVLVLTRADKVDADMLELCEAELRDLVAGTFLDGAPLVATSAVTGVGLPELVAALDALPSPVRAFTPPFRMPVDRAFVRRGFGTVVTGTAWEGTLHDGEEVELAPLGMRARVRGVQVHSESASIASAGSRVALNLAGVTLGDAARGIWVSRVGAALPCPTTLDVAFELLPDAPPLPADTRVVVLHGTREVEARIVPLGAWSDADTAGVEPLAGEGERTFLQPGTRSYVQLRLDEPLPCKAGDRFVARRASPAATLGGGVILDPWAPVVRRRDAARACALLARLEGGDTEAWLERAGTAGLNAAERRDRGVTGGVLLGDRWRDGALVTAWCTGVRENLGRWHAAHPLALGPNKKALRTGDLTCLDDREVAALVELEVAAGTVVAEGGRVRAHDFEVRLTTAQAAWCARALALVRAAGLAGVEELAGQSLDPANTFPVLGTEGGPPASNAEATALAYLLRDRGELVEIAGGGHPPRLYAPDMLDKLVADMRVWFTTHAELDPGAFKELTGQSRRTAIPLLEWLDARGVTRRRGDVRIVGA